jgi:sec-independent protein translocase protein TatA
MFGRMGPWEIALIVIVILIVFGVGKLPQVGSAIGKGVRAFRKGQSGEDEEEEEEEEEQPKPKRKTASKVTKRKATKSKAKS